MRLKIIILPHASTTKFVYMDRIFRYIYSIMKRFLVSVVVFGAALSFAVAANAQMMRWQNSGVSQEIYDHTVREETEGKDLWVKLREKQISCGALSDEEFGMLGEYFMGQMTGDAHPAMNAVMTQMHGEYGEEQIHVTMGKRLSGCDTAAAILPGGAGWMPMMNMMWGGWSSPIGNNPMGWGWGGSWFMLLPWTAWTLAGILAAAWFWKQLRKK